MTCNPDFLRFVSVPLLLCGYTVASAGSVITQTE
jgi:hypothetical protein